MNAKGTRDIAAPRDHVWAELHAAEVLQRALPACQSVSGSAAEGYTAELAHKIGPMPLSITCRVAFDDKVPPSDMRILISGRNILARGSGCVLHLTLEPRGNATVLHYAVSAQLNATLRRALGSTIESRMDRIARHVFDRFAAVIEDRSRR